MMLEYFIKYEQDILSKMENPEEQRRPTNTFELEVARLGNRLYNGMHRVAWCGVNAPFDLLNALGVVPCFVDFISCMLAFGGMANSFIEATEHQGYALDTCASHKVAIGASLMGIIPVPDFFVATIGPCNGGLSVLENLANSLKKDLFVLHVPQDDSKDNVSFLTGRLKDMVRFVSDHTGQKIDHAVLHDVMVKSNQARDLMDEVYRLTRNVPCPVNSEEMMNFGMMITILLGTDGAIDVARAYRDELKRRVNLNIAGVPGERLRLLWIFNRIQYKHSLIRMLENEYKAVIVGDEPNSMYWDPIDTDDPYEGIARRMIQWIFNGSTARRIEHLRKLAADYHVDGAINPCHWGCRQSTGTRGLVEKGLKEVGVSVLNLDTDLIDSRNFSEGQLRTRMQAFIEMLMAGQTEVRKEMGI